MVRKGYTAEDDVTLDTGAQTVYMIYEGKRMGYGAQFYAVFLTMGTQGFILQGGDCPVNFLDSKPLLIQIVKTLHFTS